MRVAVCGFPQSGKSSAYPHARHTDEVMHLQWSQASDAVVEWFKDKDKNLCIEGATVLRALRKIKKAGKPCPIDKLVFFCVPLTPLDAHQRSLGGAQKNMLLELMAWIPAVELVVSNVPTRRRPKNRQLVGALLNWLPAAAETFHLATQKPPL